MTRRLDRVRRKINKISKDTTSFDELFVDYIMDVQDKSIQLEFDYFKRHNKLDILKLDKLINEELKMV